MVKYEIPQDLLQILVNYLATRPYVEVFELIQKLQQLSKIVDDPVDDPVDAQSLEQMVVT